MPIKFTEKLQMAVDSMKVHQPKIFSYILFILIITDLKSKNCTECVFLFTS